MSELPTAEALAAMVAEYNQVEAQQQLRRQAIYQAIVPIEYGTRHIRFANGQQWTWKAAYPVDVRGVQLHTARMLGPMDQRMVSVLAGTVWSLEE